MKKIMFNDKNGLTQAVLEGIKTQTRRIMNPQPEDCSTVHRWYKSAYWKDKPMSLVVNEDGSVYCEFCGYGAKLEGGVDNSLNYAGSEFENIRNAVKALRAKNDHLIELNAFELVAITHRWDSWNRAMDFAEFMGQMSAKMSIDSIRDSSKIFDLK